MKKDVNFLDYIPKKNEEYSYEVNNNGKVVVKIVNKGFFNKIAQVAFGRPKVSSIELEEYGSFIWDFIDGKNTIYDIALKVKEKFGDNAEPLYERVSKYFQIMKANKLVFFVNEK